ncbi:MAG: hypothetical protein KBT63_11130 [Porticoccaceae bacterium]|nr:hypothetical protein [Porticoccaceae bacterium]
MISLVNFLEFFIDRMDRDGIDHCVLRNYEGLPNRSSGNDIDMLIRESDFEAIVKIIKDIDSVIITTIVRRFYVKSIFIYGVSWGDARTAIKFDFVPSNFYWKGLPYLGCDEVFNKMIEVPSSGGMLMRPSPCHEAVISFFSSYLIGKWINEKYQKNVQAVFANNRAEVLQILQGFLSRKLSNSLLNAVIDDDRDAIFTLLSSIKFQLIIGELWKNPIKAFCSAVRHHVDEIKVQFTQYPITNVCFLGVDGSGKSSVISAISRELEGVAKEIFFIHLKPDLKRSRSSVGLVIDDPHSMPPRNKVISIAKLGWWLILYWYDNYFHKHRNATLRIWDRYYYDIYVDPKRYRYGAGMRIAKFLGRFVPDPGLIVVLDAPCEVIHARKSEVKLAETKRQQEAYLTFAKERRNCVVIDTAQSLDRTVNEVLAEVLSYMQVREKQRNKFNGSKRAD